MAARHTIRGHSDSTLALAMYDVHLISGSQVRGGNNNNNNKLSFFLFSFLGGKGGVVLFIIVVAVVVIGMFLVELFVANCFSSLGNV